MFLLHDFVIDFVKACWHLNRIHSFIQLLKCGLLFNLNVFIRLGPVKIALG